MYKTDDLFAIEESDFFDVFSRAKKKLVAQSCFDSIVPRFCRQLLRSLPIRADHHPSPVVHEQVAFFSVENTSLWAWRMP